MTEFYRWTEADVERLRQRVIRARDAKRGKPIRGTRVGDEIKPMPSMTDADYAALVARGELQTWTDEDVLDLQVKVWSLTTGDTDA